MKKLFVLCFLLAGVSGCANKEDKKEAVKALAQKSLAVNDENAGTDISEKHKAYANSSEAPKQAPAEVTRKIIKEGEISFETQNIAATRKAIYNSLQKLGGYIAEENESNDSSDRRKVYVLKARIPEKNFDGFLQGVSSVAMKIDSKNIRSKDVTSDYIDYTAQLSNKKKLEDRYLELLKKGSKISDLLEIEDKITEIQTGIDETQGQLNYLLKQVAYSSLDITFYAKPAIIDDGHTFAAKLVSALSGGWNILVALFIGVVSVWPLWLIAIAMYLIAKAWYKKHQK